ncbi:MAG: ATP-binding cassette domain-containing protein [Spirochaetales bacterium]|nr:ATP-binding cassette domain-containing protein [Spirochaetales bacterium]
MLDISNISVTFNKGTPDAKTALEDFSVHVNKGDFITIIGANGAGKSTLFNAICGNFIVDKGRIVLDGQDVTFTPDHVRAKSIGRLFQDPMRGSAPNMSIEENLALAAGRGSWFSMISRQDRALFRERLSLLDMGLEDRMKQPVGLLSGGQRQALTLMMATFNPPKLLLLDEHTAALDPGPAEKVLELTKRIVSESSITCMMVTHNMQSAIDLGNRLFMLNQGHLILDVSGQEKAALTVPTLVDMFRRKSGSELQTDRMLLMEQD